MASRVSFEIAGKSWGFLSDPPPRCHLATPDRHHVIWLENAGDRILRAHDASLPRCEIVALRYWLREHRRLVERAWLTEVVIPNSWVDIYKIEEGDLVVEVYAKTSEWFGVVVPIEEVEVEVAGEDDFAIDPKTGELLLGVEDEEQQRVDLAERIWRPLR